MVGDTDTLDLDPRSFTNRLDIVQLEILNEKTNKKITETKNINKEKTSFFKGYFNKLFMVKRLWKTIYFYSRRI